MEYFLICKNSLTVKVRLIFILFFSFFFICIFKAHANYLDIRDNNLLSEDGNVLININSNQKIEFDGVSKAVKLIENDSVIQYFIYTTDIKYIRAYAGQPLDLLVALNPNGIIDDIKLIKHSEPILLTGIPIEKLLEAVSFYKGRNINTNMSVGESSDAELCIPIITGATLTSIILHQTVLDTVREVAKVYDIFHETNLKERTLTTNFIPMTWDYLLSIGAVKHFVLDKDYITGDKANKDELYVDIYYADILHPSIGRNLLGEDEYFSLIEELDKGSGKSAIMVINGGEWSYKGNAFVRGGIYDRFRIEQGSAVFNFRDTDHCYLYDLEPDGAPEFQEKGIFKVYNEQYMPGNRWNLVIQINNKAIIDSYSIPEVLLVDNIPSYPWLETWNKKSSDIFYFLLLWTVVIFIFLFRNSISKYDLMLSVIYNSVLLVSICMIGIMLKAQASIVNLFALIDDVATIDMFLLEPCLFLGWVLIIITVFLWGKSLFCGWICPFGALQEILFKIRSKILKTNKSIEFSYKVNNRLRLLKYFIFLFLLSVSFIGMIPVEFCCEIEPFKTVWLVGIDNREWYISLYSITLLILSVFTYRFFCRFLCPLGAFLSFLSIFQYFKLKRRKTCKACAICEKTCGSLAINKEGEIDNKECFGCFTCINNMYNEKLCPPLNSEKIWNKHEGYQSKII